MDAQLWGRVGRGAMPWAEMLSEPLSLDVPGLGYFRATVS